MERTKFEVDGWLIGGVALIAKACTRYLNRFSRFVSTDKQDLTSEMDRTGQISAETPDRSAIVLVTRTDDKDQCSI